MRDRPPRARAHARRRASGGRRRLRRLLTAAGIALLALAAAFALVLPAGAAAPDAVNQARLDLTIRFLQDVQNPDGGFGGARGRPSDPGFTAWVALALAAGGINPQDQRRPGGTDAWAYVVEHVGELRLTTDYERVALVAVAAGVPLRDVGGVDLVQRILARRLPSGAFVYDPQDPAAAVNATAFAILPLSTLREPAVDAVLQRSVDWMLGAKAPGGGWNHAGGRLASADDTAAVIQALHAAGRGGTPEEAQAWNYLRSLHNADGGFGFDTAFRASNAASTAWVVQAMWAAGVDPATYAPDWPSPLDYLASLQRPDGSIAFKAGDDLNAVWMTAYAAPAYGGRPLPIAAVARAAPPSAAQQPTSQPTLPPSAAVEQADVEGEGGFGRARGGAVIAGGGGRGAPLYGRPQPQSRGAAPGGVRDTTPAAARRPAARRAAAAARADRARDRRAAGAGAGGSGDPEVTGVVLGDGPLPAAPGLAGAQAGGRTPGPALALALTGALLLCAGLGTQLERRRPGALA